VIVLKIKREETFWREPIEIPEQFIEDVCSRFNTIYETTIEEEDEMDQFAYFFAILERHKISI